MIAYLRRLGIETDIWLSVLSGGAAGETISMRVARACAAGGGPACAVCWWLGRTVETGHCAKQLSGTSSAPQAALLAGLQLLAAFVLVVGLPWFLLGHLWR